MWNTNETHNSSVVSDMINNIAVTNVYINSTTITYEPISNISDGNVQFHQMQETPFPMIIILIAQYANPIIFVVGIILNLLSFIVFCRKHFRNTSMGFLLRIVALADLGETILHTGYDFIWNPIVNNDIHICISYVASNHLAMYISVWTLTLFAFERLVAVCFPLSTNIILTPFHIKIMWLCVLCLPVVGTIIASLSYSIVPYGNFLFCAISREYVNFMTWSLFILYNLLPFLIMLICNVVIVIRLIGAKYRRRNMASQNMHVGNTTAMLLGVSFWFLITTGPGCFLMILNLSNYRSKSPLLMPLLLHFSRFLVSANHALNFLFYCVTGQRFRQEMKLVFQCLLCKESMERDIQYRH